ncbi:MAG: hypothetical protein ABIJ12_07685, partial [bacterium]
MKKNKKQDNNFLNLTFSVVVLFLLIRLLASFYQEERLWGLNHAGYINGMVFLYIAMIIIAVYVYF